MLGPMKYLMLIAFLVLVLLALRRAGRARASAKPKAEREPERMVACAFCGVNQPLSESILSSGRYFCCIAHQQAAGNDAER